MTFLATLHCHPVASLLVSRTSAGTLRDELGELIRAVLSEDFDFDFDRVKPLLKEALADKPQDTLIWDLVSTAALEPTISGLTNWSETDLVLKFELERLYVGLPNFHKTFFGDVPDLDTVSETVFSRCTEGDDPLFKEGWSEWPAGAKEIDVLTWLTGLIPKLEAFAGDHISTPVAQRKLLAQGGSVRKRCMDIGFVNLDIIFNPDSKRPRYHWSHILVVGKLKSNPTADQASVAWIDLAAYAREVLAAQDTRRFVLGFTLCGSLMRVWEFDRLGGVASEQFDINKNDGGLQFVTTILGFLWMNEDGLGFDPTIITSGSERYIEIERDGQTQRLIIDEVITRAPCIAGRATTCWKAHRKEDPQTPLVIKDSWQCTDRDEEGILIQEATEKGVVNVVRHYHHETIRVCGADDDVRNNIRKGLDITTATNYRSRHATLPSSASASNVSRQGRSGSAGVKRPSGDTDAALPPSKRSCSASTTKASVEALQNRVHRRVILCDFGKPIYKASSHVALLAALEGCIEGHESLHKAGFLHRDISINNLMINEDDKNPSRRAFLIDLDFAIKVQREDASGAKRQIGTRAFMAIGALMGEQHSFGHDLESFFWVLFWICIHCDGANRRRVVPSFDKWNYMKMEQLALMKLGTVGTESLFMKTITDNTTPYCTPLIPWLNMLRKTVFPEDDRLNREDEMLSSRMRDVLRRACSDLDAPGQSKRSRCSDAVEDEQSPKRLMHNSRYSVLSSLDASDTSDTNK